MVEDRIGQRYATSIFELAKEKGQLDTVRADMELIRNAARDIWDVRNFLNTPLIKADKKEKIFSAIFGKDLKSQFTPLLAQIMIRKHRETYLPHTAQAFLDLYDKENKIERGKIISASPLSDAQFEIIRKEVEVKTGKTFIASREVDTTLIGGFVLHVGDKLFDGSLSTSLNKLSQDFQQNVYQKQI
jgi:F-type H+-transporting ATPase subunit delta